MAKFVCTVCGYTAENEAPEACPVCKAPKTAFKELDENTLATIRSIAENVARIFIFVGYV